MVRHAEEADQAFLPSFQQPRIGALGIVGIGQLGGIMQLQNIHMVRFQIAQARFEIFQQSFPVARLTLGCEEDVVPHIGQGVTDFLLAVRVAPRRIKKVNALRIGLAQDRFGVVERDPLNGQSAEAAPTDLQLGPSQSHFFHGESSLVHTPCGQGWFVFGRFSRSLAKYWSISAANIDCGRRNKAINALSGFIPSFSSR